MARSRRRGEPEDVPYEPEPQDQDAEEEEEGEEAAPLPEWLRNAPYWAISGALHLLLLLVMSAYVCYVPPPAETEHKLVVKRPYQPPKYDPTLKRDIKRTPRILDKKQDRPVIQLKPDELTQIPKGTDMNNLSNKNLEARDFVDAFGVGGGASGAYGNRWGKGSLIREGGGEGTESAVLAALEWLRRHQNPDGSWSCRDFTGQCDKAQGPCKNKSKGYTDGRGFPSHDVGVTALAVLAFTGFGHTHQFGEREEFVTVVRKAMQWLKSQQVMEGDPDDRGRYGWPQIKIRDWKADPAADPYKATIDEQWIYDHSLATMATAELLLLTQDKIGLGKNVELAAELCLRAQNDGYGWRYGVKPGDNDTSVTGWMILALKACKAADMRRPAPERYEKAFKDALEWFKRATSVSTGITGYKAPGDEGSRLNGIYPEPYPFSKELSCMTAVAVLCRLFAGEKRTDDMIKKGVTILLRETPSWQEQAGNRMSKINVYYWYYGTYALFQYGGVPWKEWNEKMKKSLIDTQRVGGCEDGSWDPIDEWGAAGGRVYTTALGAMTLEVYYRYVRAQEGKGF